MPILNYTTQIDSEKTIMEIQKVLVTHGATKITTDYSPKGIPCAVTFCINFNGNMIAYALPANSEGVLRAMKNNKKVPNSLRNEEQAQRVAWRIIKEWVVAQCAIVEANVSEMTEVFLPYAILPNGKTLFQNVKEQPRFLQLTSGHQ